MSGQLVVIALAAGLSLWVLHALGRALTKLLEAAAAVAVVFAAVWLAVKGVWTTGRSSSGLAAAGGRGGSGG